MKTIKLTQNAYSCGTYDNPEYRATAKDEDGIEYTVTWKLADDSPEFMERIADDESYACDWEHPYSVIDEDGNELDEGTYEIEC